MPRWYMGSRGSRPEEIGQQMGKEVREAMTVERRIRLRISVESERLIKNLHACTQSLVRQCCQVYFGNMSSCSYDLDHHIYVVIFTKQFLLTLRHVESRKEKFTIADPAFSISCIANHTCNQVTNEPKVVH